MYQQGAADSDAPSLGIFLGQQSVSLEGAMSQVFTGLSGNARPHLRQSAHQRES